MSKMSDFEGRYVIPKCDVVVDKCTRVSLNLQDIQHFSFILKLKKTQTNQQHTLKWVSWRKTSLGNTGTTIKYNGEVIVYTHG